MLGGKFFQKIRLCLAKVQKNIEKTNYTVPSKTLARMEARTEGGADPILWDTYSYHQGQKVFNQKI